MLAIVLAGGGGTRLWPLSREDFPKQFLNFGGGFSLLEQTVQRLKSAPFIDKIIVSTNELHRTLVEEQLERIDAKCPILVEPCRRNTGPAIALAVKYLQEKYGANSNDSVLVIPSDHLIEPDVIFFNALERLEPKDTIITFGIRPNRVETGYGYIEIGQKVDALTFKAKNFIEKPDLKRAEKYTSSPSFFWNSGMFLFTIDTFWKELKLYSPSIHTLFQEDLESALKRFEQAPNLSIDYALMEKSKEILVCPLAVTWSDVGSWDSVYEVMEKDIDQNVKIGQVHTINTTNSLIIGGKRIISTIGLDDLLIIETEDAVLISKKGESQRVKNLLQELKARANADQT